MINVFIGAMIGWLLAGLPWIIFVCLTGNWRSDVSEVLFALGCFGSILAAIAGSTLSIIQGYNERHKHSSSGEDDARTGEIVRYHIK